MTSEPEHDGKWYGDQRLDTLKANLIEAVGADLTTAHRLAHTGAGSGLQVIVVGAGFAGAAAAFCLRALGFSVTLYDAADRVGGRVLTNRTLLPGRGIEFGAELIGWNHALWRGLAETFGLTFEMLPDLGDEYPGPYYLSAQDLSAKTRAKFSGEAKQPLVTGQAARALKQRVDAATEGLAALARSIRPYRPWVRVEDAQQPPAWFDGQTLSDWLDDATDELEVRIALETLFSNDNVRSSAEQSLLGVVTQIAGGGGRRFDEDTEVMRCAQGNDELATQLSRTLPDEYVRLRTRIDRISFDGDRVRVDGDTLDSADFVVVAVPPSVYTDPKRLTIEGFTGRDYDIQTGPAVKHFAVTADRPWMQPGLGDLGKSTPIGETWEATAGAASGPFELSLFAGGPAAQRALVASRTDPKADRFYTPELERLFPGFEASSTEFQPWPEVEHIWCGYSAIATGQLSNAERLATPFNGRVVFAGEHTCPAFYGYMEGALESGFLAAHQILAAIGFYKNGRPTILDAFEAACAAGSEY